MRDEIARETQQTISFNPLCHTLKNSKLYKVWNVEMDFKILAVLWN